MRHIYRKLGEQGLTVKASKCQWAKETVKIGGGKVRPLEARVEAIKNFIRPSTKTQLRSFLGMAGVH